MLRQEEQRILDLPRRALDPAAARASELARLKAPGGSMELHPIQIAALLEAKAANGLLAPIGVGRGKTLISFLLPSVLGAERPLLLIPASLRPQVMRRMVEWRAHWRIPDIKVLSYYDLSRKENAHALEEYAPDLIIADECHRLADCSTATTRRFLGYCRLHPGTRFCGLSGTITSKTIREYAHLARLALGNHSPVPFEFVTLRDWCDTLTPGWNTPWYHKPAEGLKALAVQGSCDVHEAYRRRLVETRGVVATAADQLGCSLAIAERKVTVPPEVKRAVAELEKTWATPGGEELTDALSYYRHAQTLSAGFYLEWIWPEHVSKELRGEWLECRRAWFQELRGQVAGGRYGDSEALVTEAANRGAWKPRALDAFRDIGCRVPEPKTRAVWLSDFVVKDAVEWAKGGGIVWYEWRALGEAIAKAGGFARYGQGPKASAAILDADGTRPIVVSVDAHHEGKDLQRFCRNLVTTNPANGRIWEQLLGRTHRDGQAADEVECNVYGHTAALRGAFKQARFDAAYIERTLGTEQKLVHADFGAALLLG